MSSDNELLFDWLHDRLQPAELQHVAARLKGEPALRQRLAQLALGEVALTQALRNSDAERSQARRPAVARARQSRTRQRPRQARWVLPSLAAAAAAAVIAILLLRLPTERPAPAATDPDDLARSPATLPEASPPPPQGDWHLGPGQRLQARGEPSWAGSARQPVLRAGAATLYRDEESAGEALTLRSPHGELHLATAPQQVDIEVDDDSTLLAQMHGRSQVQAAAFSVELNAGEALILRSEASRPLSPVAWLWQAENPDPAIAMSGTLSRIDQRQVLVSGSSNYGHPGWRPDQHLGLWVDGRSLVQISNGRLRLLVHAERAGTLTVTVALAEPRRMDNEHNYWQQAIPAGWQTLDLPLSAFAGPEDARPADGNPINAIGLWGEGSGRLGLATASFDAEP
ncbi:MAG: hypothetical protein EA402_01080 [Planctomycetota bacterium]|nr:MAG: hypothetical protein EA402_01080 [Planctomycetota bacterium]